MMAPELACLEGGRDVPPIPFRRPPEPPPPPPLYREIRGPLVVWAIITSVSAITGAIVWNGQQLRALHESVDAALNDMGLLRTKVEMIEKRVDKGEQVDKELGEQIIQLKIRVR
jgi:hypothetical protein